MLCNTLSLPSGLGWRGWSKRGCGWIIIDVPLLCFNTMPAEYNTLVDMLSK